MNLRNVDIAQKLSAWMDRYAVPMHLRENPKAAQAEAESLARILCKFAPLNDYQPFLNRVFDVLDGQLKHRVWPTGVEMGAACANLRKESNGQQGTAPPQKTPEEMIAARMERGDPVSESYLYGLAAVELIAGRYVNEQTMTAYRSGAFFSRRENYGEAAALAWEAEAKERHELAKGVYRARESGRGIGGNIPNKRVA